MSLAPRDPLVRLSIPESTPQAPTSPAASDATMADPAPPAFVIHTGDDEQGAPVLREMSKFPADSKVVEGLFNTYMRGTLSAAASIAKQSGQVFDPNSEGAVRAASEQFIDRFRTHAREKWQWDEHDINAQLARLGLGAIVNNQQIAEARAKAIRQAWISGQLGLTLAGRPPGPIYDAEGVPVNNVWELLKGAFRLGVVGISVPLNLVKGGLATADLSLPEEVQWRVLKTAYGTPREDDDLFQVQGRERLRRLLQQPNPFFNPEVRKLARDNYQEFIQETFLNDAFQYPSYTSPIAQKLEDVGVHPALARFVNDDVLDPTNYAMGGIPLILGLGAKSFLRTAQLMRATGTAISRGEFLTLMRTVRESLPHVGQTIAQRHLDATDLGKLATEHNIARAKAVDEARIAANIAHPGVGWQSEEWAARFTEELTARGIGTAKGKPTTTTVKKWVTDPASGKRMLTKTRVVAMDELVKSLSRKQAPIRDRAILRKQETRLAMIARKLDPMEQVTYMRARMANLQTDDEVFVFQATHSGLLRKMFNKVPGGIDVYKSLFKNRNILKQEFFNPYNGKVIRVSAGIMSDFMRNKSDYLKVTEEGKIVWQTAKSGKRSRRAIAMMQEMEREGWQFDDLLDLGQYVDTGRSPLTRQVMRIVQSTLAQSRGEIPHLGAVGSFLARAQVRFSRGVLSNTGAWDLYTKAEGYANSAKATRMLELGEILGGEPMHFGTHLDEIMDSGAMGVGLDELPKIMSPRAILPRLERTQKGLRLTREVNIGVRNLNDEIFALLGNDAQRAFLNDKRAADALAPIDLANISRDGKLAADRLRLWLNELHEEAQRFGLITPGQYLNEYLPTVRSALDRVSPDKWMVELRNLGRRMRLKGMPEAEAFFTKVRTGELSVQETSIPRLMEAYVDRLYYHAYKKPVIEDLRRIASSADPASIEGTLAGIARRRSEPLRTPIMGIRDREFMLDWLDHVQGAGISKLQLGISSWHAKLGFFEDTLSRLGLMERPLKPDPARAASHMDMFRKTSRAIADMYYFGYLGFRTGSAAKNLTQKTLALGLLGHGLDNRLRKSPGYLINAERAFRSDPQRQSRFAQMALRHNWMSDFREFMTSAFETRAASIIPQQWRDFGLRWFRLADADNRAKVFTAAELYIEDLFDQVGRGAANVDPLISRMRTTDGALLRDAFATRDLSRAREVFAKYLVEETQFIYSSANRPKLSEVPFVQLMYLFNSWPGNYLDYIVQGMSSGAKRAKALPMLASKPRLQEAERVGRGAFQGAMELLAPITVFGMGMDSVGRVAHLDFGRWFFIETPQPDWMREAEIPGVDPDAKTFENVPLGPTQPLAMFGRAAEDPLAMSPAGALLLGPLRLLLNDSLQGTEEDRKRTWKLISESLPLPLAFMEPLKMALGIEDRFGYEGVERLLRSQGIPVERVDE